MKTTLLIMAAGIGSRFGTGIKQLEPVDASNHIIMDYSIHPAGDGNVGSLFKLWCSDSGNRQYLCGNDISQ